MPYNNIISRADSAALVPEDVSQAFRKNLETTSAAMELFTRVPVGAAQVRFPVLSALPIAYWVTGDTGLKQTSEVNWANKYLDVEEIAVICPIPENVLDDSGFPIWDEVRPLMEQAAGRTLDASVFFGVNAPSVFPDDLVTAATAAGNVAERDTATVAEGGIVADFGELYGLLEDQGFSADGGIAAKSLRGPVRRARNTQGDRYAEVNIDRDGFNVDDVRFETGRMPGLWPTAAGSAQAIVLDQQEYVIGVRQDVSFKILDQAVIQDNTGEIVYNLAQQDMVALRLTLRVGWQVANTINYDQPDEEERYPAAVLTSPAG